MEQLLLKDVCSFANGKAHEQFVDEKGNYILITSKFIASDGESFRRTNDRLLPLEIGDLCMVMSDVPNGRALAKCFLVDKNNTYTLNQRIGVFKADDRFLKRYFYYQMNRNKYFLSFDDGDSQTNLRKDDILNCPMICPSKAEQKVVVNILDRVSSVINKRQKELLYLDELIKARFVELFGLPGSDDKGWGLKRLGDCCEINPKKALDTRLVSGLEVSFVPMPAVSENGEIDTSEKRLFDEVKTGFTYFIDNDVLFAKITPCMENGKGAVAVGLSNGIGFGSTEFHVLRPLIGRSNPYWLYTVTSFVGFRKDAEANMTGSAGQRRVPSSFLDNYKVSLPPIELQERFADFVKQVDKSKVVVHKSLSATKELFNSLLQEYFG